MSVLLIETRREVKLKEGDMGFTVLWYWAFSHAVFR